MAVTVAGAVPARAQEKPAIHIVKDPNCGCCTAWAQILNDDGFAVTFEHSSEPALTRFKQRVGLPKNMASCHTAIVEGYAIEGHVPAAEIRRLLAERPDAVGLSVPGMPYGSPGMGPESDRDAYSVYLVRRDGSVEVFSHYPAG
ncbi:DUF411 domain-containing protein [Marimonas arenosa]|uniref:DUF411 domain-containing protein n=2 Tax=Marimonas arenosa TaxID=1795305 RepID=A0AAE4B5C2_9RHOB|nr:DUF411 domain-containing protein [Marimonas arenosa]MDQ2090199.1 DUF411 domain-containing protein [Marimonas arenosa]